MLYNTIKTFHGKYAAKKTNLCNVSESCTDHHKGSFYGVVICAINDVFFMCHTLVYSRNVQPCWSALLMLDQGQEHLDKSESEHFVNIHF